MDSTDLARFIEATDGISKPWLLVQLRLKKLQERRAELSDAEYIAALDELQTDLMNLGEWWVGREAEVFGFEPPKE
ncbi:MULTISPECIES: hypothetical protein [unclassified Leptolyngbya]|uniref:hypothetical protein n=1 Tax=unclassified Leptolyngbya TaxID=2650499 RepID=UPI0016838752|nr:MULTISPECIES: hypothetical protein [unclassified Leptolyngbya]MBD1912224.1 hypothetical protein [Leptolyngbya sp. FACHB-8]MBD2155115.1 hypothetical protein [Leptolyngbya sp. FACHB-16]